MSQQGRNYGDCFPLYRLGWHLINVRVCRIYEGTDENLNTNARRPRR